MPEREAVIQHKVTHVGRDVRHRNQAKHVVNVVFSPADGGKTDETARWESGRYGDAVVFTRNCIECKYVYFL